LPEPFGPAMTVIAPGGKAALTLSRTAVLP